MFADKQALACGGLSVYTKFCTPSVGEQFSADNILTADIHHDQGAPHCHVLVLPLIDGRMVGSKLINRPATAKLHTSFAPVAKEFGLKPPPSKLSGSSRATGAQMVLARLESTQDAILRSVLWDVIRDGIKADPAPYMAALGISRDVVKPKAVQKTMAQIFTSPGRGQKREQSNPIGFAVASPKHRTLCPVGFAPPELLVSAKEATTLITRAGPVARRCHRAGGYGAYRESTRKPLGFAA